MSNAITLTPSFLKRKKLLLNNKAYIQFVSTLGQDSENMSWLMHDYIFVIDIYLWKEKERKEAQGEAFSYVDMKHRDCIVHKGLCTPSPTASLQAHYDANTSAHWQSSQWLLWGEM